MIYDNLAVSPEGHLTFAGWDTVTLAESYGTPLMLMDEMRIRNRCREYRSAMQEYLPEGSRPLYASKAFSAKGIYTLMHQEHMGVDVVSAGELYTAAQAGFPMEDVFFHGNSKTSADIRLAMEYGIGYFVCDNADELCAIDEEAARRGIRQKILLRLAPGIDPHTHAKINTGRVDSKFGAAIETGQAEALTREALSLAHIDLRGYHCHIGSQIFEHSPFCDAAVIMLEFAAQMERRHGFVTQVLNLGGGMAVPYTQQDSPIAYRENIRNIGALILRKCQQLNIQPPAILMEPGRSIVADAGITLYTVQSIKKIPGYRNYVAVDGGMTDNPRYSLYQSAYTVLPADNMHAPADFSCTVAGCCCESGDLIQEDVTLPEPQRGDLLAVLTTGAYNYAMASNYNRKPRPPVVMIGEEGPRVLVRRESYADIVRNDI